MYCIAFNGPPRSGKDTIANAIDQKFELAITPTIRKALIMPIRQVAFAILGQPYDEQVYELIKDKPQGIFNNKTVREFMIDLMEKYIKPTYGEDFAVRSTINSLGTGIHLPGICLISDLGFQVEVESLEEAFGPDRVLVVQLIREGVYWGNDSRGWVEGQNTLRWANHTNKQSTTVKELLIFCEHALGWEI